MVFVIVGLFGLLLATRIAHAFSLSLSVDGANKVLASWTRTEEVEVNYAPAAALGVVSDQATGVAFTIANLRSLVIWADQTITIKTNSTGTPQETLTITAGIPLIWDASMPGFVIGELFAGNVTNMYITTTVATNVKIYACITT